MARRSRNSLFPTKDAEWRDLHTRLINHHGLERALQIVRGRDQPTLADLSAWDALGQRPPVEREPMKAHLAPREIPRRLNELQAGKWVRQHLIECSICKGETRMTDATHGWKPPQHVLERFRMMGWSIGRDRTRDLCPACAAAITPVPKPEKETLPMPVRQEEEAPFAVFVEEEKATVPPPKNAWKPAKTKRRTGVSGFLRPPKLPGAIRLVSIATRGFSTRQSAQKAAQNYFLRAYGKEVTENGRDYVIYQDGKRHNWRELSPGEIAGPFTTSSGRTRVYPPRSPHHLRTFPINTNGFAYPSGAAQSARRYFDRVYGLRRAREGVHFTVQRDRDASTYNWATAPASPLNPAPAPKPTETTMQNLATPMLLNLGGPTLSIVPANDPHHAEVPHKPSPAQRREVLDALTAAYNEKAGCYLGDMNDRRLAETLGVPRAWVSDIREGFFGPEISTVAMAKAKDDAAFASRLREGEQKAIELATAFEAMRVEFEKRTRVA